MGLLSTREKKKGKKGKVNFGEKLVLMPGGGKGKTPSIIEKENGRDLAKKKRKKGFGTSLYRKKTPPTPAKEGGALSAYRSWRERTPRKKKRYARPLRKQSKS